MPSSGSYMKTADKKIIVRSPNWIGDAVLATPFIKALRAKFPYAYIAVLSKPWVYDIWKANTYIDEIIEYKNTSSAGFLKIVKEIKNKKFDTSIILPKSFSSALMMFLAGVNERVGFATEGRGFLLNKKAAFANEKRLNHMLEEFIDIGREIGLEFKDKEPYISIDKDDEIHGELILLSNGVSSRDKIVGVCPAAAYGPAKRWFLERFIEASRKIIKKHHVKILLFGSKAEADLIKKIKDNIEKDAIALAGQVSLGEMCAILKKCRFVLTNDTGPMHVAAALKIPTISIFGSSSPAWTSPIGKKHIVIYKKVKCSPCFEKTCKNKQHPYKCFDLIKTEEVLYSVDKILKN